MKKNICSKTILLVSLFLLSVGTMTASCTSKNDTRQEETVSADSKGEKDGKIIHITAEYMREHIYDYTANPQEWDVAADVAKSREGELLLRDRKSVV